MFTLPAKQNTLVPTLSEVDVKTLPRHNGVNYVFSNQLGILGVPQPQNTPDNLYGALQCILFTF